MSARPVDNYDEPPVPLRGTRAPTHSFYDWPLEAELLGNIFIAPARLDEATAAGVDVNTFHHVAHQHWWRAIEACGPDFDLCRVWLREHDLLDQAVMEDVLAGGNRPWSPAHLAQLVAWQRDRHVYSTLNACLNGQFAQTRQIIGELADEMDRWVTPAETEGIFEDMRAVAEGGLVGEPPSVGVRDDSACAFWYRGKVNSIIGESESGKSWLVQWHAVQEINLDHHVIYLDFEKDAAAVYERLTLMSADPERVFSHFHYKRVEDPFGLAELTALRAACKELEPTLFVVDGVTNAMQLEGLKIESNNDISKFLAGLPAIGRSCGAAAVLVDHLVKNPENPTKGAIGGQHKRAGIDGATLKMVMRDMPGRNRTGNGYLLVDKDAPGWLREHAVDGKAIGDVTIHSDGDSTVVQVMPSTRSETSKSSSGAPRLTGYMERVSKVLEPFGDAGQSGRSITKMVQGEDKHVLAALRTLVEEGWVKVERKGSANLHTSARAYREAMDRLVKAPAVSDAADLGLEDEPPPDEWGDQPWG